MPTYSSLVKIENLPAATTPTTPSTDLTVLGVGPTAYKITINDLVSGATASSFTIGTASVTGTLAVTGAATLSSTLTVRGNTVTVGAGSTATIDLTQSGTGNWRFNLGGSSSVYNFRTSTGGSIARLTPTSSAVNYLNVTSANTGNNVILAAAGSDTNVSMTASAQGTGIWNFTVPVTGKFFNSAPGTITWSGATTDSTTLNPFRMTGVTHTGSSSASEIYLNLLNVAGTDNINMATGKVVGWRFNHNVAAGAVGTRNGLHYQIATTGATTGMDFLTAANFFANINHDTGGTAYTSAGSVGQSFGLNSYAIIASGVNYTAGAVGFESDVSVRNAGGTYRKAGIQVVADSLDAGSGVALDVGVVVASQTGAVGFTDAYAVTGWPAQNPLMSSGETSAFRAYYGINYSTYGNRAYWGVNIRELDIAGYAFASDHWLVAPDGTTQIGLGSIQTTATGISISAGASEGTAAVVNAAGTNYAVNDILYDSDGAGGTYGGVYRVATLSGSGVATVTILKAPMTTGSPPATVATTTWQVTGQGTGCTLDLTWSTGTDVTIGENADDIYMPSLQASTSYADDAAAAAGGVAIGQLYRNGSVVQIRIS